MKADNIIAPKNAPPFGFRVDTATTKKAKQPAMTIVAIPQSNGFRNTNSGFTL
jgi:hypothetical protein